MLRQAPDRVLKTAFIATSPWPDSPESTEKRRQQIRLAEAGKFVEIVNQSKMNAVHPNHEGEEWGWVRDIHFGMAMDLGADVFIRHQHAAITRPDSRPNLPGIGVPSTVIIAEGDRVIPRQASEEIADGIPNASRTLIPEAGHMLLLEQKDAVSAALEGWLAQ
jgi:pimeloyl-ACP methyl ester carboxylesterase